MIWALNNNKKISAKPKQKATCPLCNSQLIPKCGSIKIWHWSHKNNKDCDDWHETESEWHKSWKNKFLKAQQEFVMGKHRADIRTSKRWVIELQNSSISSDEIIERENYYKKMVWLLNGKTLGKGLELRSKKSIITFRWKHPPKSWWFANKEIYIDFGDKSRFNNKIFHIKKIHPNIPCGGWGYLISKEDFIKKFN